MTSRAGARGTPWTGLALGVVLLAVMLLFAVLLPRAAGGSHEGSAMDLPDTLPGGWTTVGDFEFPEDLGDDFAEEQQVAVDHVNDALGGVYGEGAAFRRYAQEGHSRFVAVTVFDAPGGALAPPYGLTAAPRAGKDRPPVELVREGDAVCVVVNLGLAHGAVVDPDILPLDIRCQLSEAEQTYQIGSQQLSVEETVDLLEAVADR